MNTQDRVRYYLEYGEPLKTRTVTLGPPVCAYCGDLFEGAYLHRRNADWHSGCWLQMSNDKDDLEQSYERERRDNLRRGHAMSKRTDEELAEYVKGYRQQGLTYGDLADCYLFAIDQYINACYPLQTELQTAERITTDDTCINQER